MTLAANAQKHVGQLGKGDFGSETLVEGTILLGHAQVLVQIGSHLKPRGKVAVMYLLYSRYACAQGVVTIVPRIQFGMKDELVAGHTGTLYNLCRWVEGAQAAQLHWNALCHQFGQALGDLEEYAFLFTTVPLRSVIYSCYALISTPCPASVLADAACRHDVIFGTNHPW